MSYNASQINQEIAELVSASDREKLQLETVKKQVEELKKELINELSQRENCKSLTSQAQQKLELINQEIKGANSELELIKSAIRAQQVNLQEAKQIQSEFLKEQENLKEAALIELKEISESIDKQKKTFKALEENSNSIIQATESASNQEKELLGKALELQKGLQLLRDEEESQLTLTQQAKLKKEEVLNEIEELKAERHQLQTQIIQEKAKLRETDEALLLKNTELSTVIGEINEKLQIIQIAEQKLNHKKKQIDQQIAEAKADKLIS
jgi:chromosome segregation ATPase